jgi:hypothetical protein
MAKNGSKPKVNTWEQHLEQYAFRGELEFDLSFDLLGQRFTRLAKVIYAYTPGDWRFFDPKIGKTRKGVESAVYHVDVRLVHEVWEDDGTGEGIVKEGEPYWFTFGDFIRDDMLPTDVLNAIIDAVDEKCRAEDAERRRAAGV